MEIIICQLGRHRPKLSRSSIKYHTVRIIMNLPNTYLSCFNRNSAMCNVKFPFCLNTTFDRINQKACTKWLRCVQRNTGKNCPHNLFSTYAGGGKLIAETILTLHHQVSKIVRGDMNHRELFSNCTVLSLSLNYNPCLHQLFDHPSQHVAISSCIILLPAKRAAAYKMPLLKLGEHPIKKKIQKWFIIFDVIVTSVVAFF